MKEILFYDIETEEYVTENDLWEQYDEYIECEDNNIITFTQFVNNCLTINGGTLERVGF